MDVSANRSVAISGTRPVTAQIAAARTLAPALSADVTDAPSPAPGAIAAAVERLPPNIRYAPSHPARDASLTSFDRSA